MPAPAHRLSMPQPDADNSRRRSRVAAPARSPTRMPHRSCMAMLLKAIAVEADGLFYRRADNAIGADGVENRPIDADSG